MRHGLRVIAAGCFSCSCRCARAFLSPTPSHHHSTAATKGRPSTSTAPPPALGVQLPLKNLGIPAALWAGQQVQGNSEAGESGGAMPPTGDERHHPSALRNRGFIAAELVKWLGGQDSGSSSPSAASSSEAPGLLEIASGTGCHAEAFAKALPAWSFQPTEYDQARIPEISATIEEGQHSNIRPPVALDVCSDASTWPRPAEAGEGGGGAKLWDAVMCSNMIHISPKECTSGLLKGAAAGLKMGGRLFIYGPFALSGTLAPDSNKDFDASLKARSGGSWGIRDAAWVADLADEQGLELTDMTLMPANNFFVVFKKVKEASGSTGAEDDDARKARVAEVVSAVVLPAREALVASLAAK